MSKVEGRIDFELLVTVESANPNGDPLEENRPRMRTNGLGEISDVCLKRKIRNRFQDLGYKIFVQTDERSDDGCRSLKARVDSCERLKNAMKGKETDGKECAKIACEEWLDVRAFGQVFAFKGTEMSVGVRGPVSIQQALSISPIEVETLQITKSVNSEDKNGRSSDTMGVKYLVPFGLYIVKGSVSAELADKTGFTKEDAGILKTALRTLFEGDSSAAHPAGSMEVRKMYWWEHTSRTPEATSAEIFRSVMITPKVAIPEKFEDYEIELKEIKGIVAPEII